MTWGLCYKIVTRKFGALSAHVFIDSAKMDKIVDGLFPLTSTEYSVLEEEISLLYNEELEDPVRSFQNKKAPGPDAIPAQALKAVANVN